MLTRTPCITSLLGTEPRTELPRKAWDRMLTTLDIGTQLPDDRFDAFMVRWLQRQDAKATKARKETA